MRTKLVYLTTDPGLGGGPKHILDLANSVDHKKFEVYVVAPEGWLLSQVKSQKLKVKSYQLYGESRGQRIKGLKGILGEIKGRGYPFAPVVLHAHSPQAVFIASRAISHLGIYLVYTEHLWTKDYHLDNRAREIIQLLGLKRALTSASKVIAVSQAVGAFLIDTKIVSREKVEVIYPVIQEVKSQKSKVKSASQKSKVIAQAIKIGAVGALLPVKGFDVLIEAVAMVKKDEPNISLEIVGEGPEKANLTALIEKYNLIETIKLLGRVEPAKMAEKYPDWNLFVQPSKSETFGLSVFEALSNGLPVVASRVGGLTELVTNGVNGFLVKKGDVAALAFAIGKIVEDQGLRSKLAQCAMEVNADKRFKGAENLTKINQIYLNLINNGTK
jgi:glycosyltransferase involved in cell wall biosynthesis